MKLHYQTKADSVAVTLYTGEKFSDENKEVHETVEFNVADIPAELKNGDEVVTLAAYGLAKLLQDRTSQDKGAKEKLESMQKYFTEFFTQGLWKKPAAERTATTGSRRKIGASLAEAVARLQGISAIQAEAALKALTKEQFDGLVANPRVVDMVKEIEAEAGDTVQLGDLL